MARPGDPRAIVARPGQVPLALAALGGLAVALSGIRGADYPAQFLHAELWRRAGSGIWNFTWYGGHATPSYSVVMPPAAAVLGPVALCVLSGIAGTYAFTRLLHRLAPPSTPPLALTLAGVSFAGTAVVNVVVGRAPFAFGLAVALLAACAWEARRVVPAVALALLTPLCSPVAGAFLAIVAAAVGVDALLGRRHRLAGEASAVLAAAMLPLGLMTLLFPDGGRFPFRGDSLVFSLVLMALAGATYRHRVVHLALAAAAVSSLVLFVVPNPLGGNFLRFTQFLVVPVAIAGVPTVTARWARPSALLAVAGAVWSLQFGVVALAQSVGDDSVEAGYHEPLIDEIARRNADGLPVGRVEIPFTDNHWEAYFVATEVPYARGWERQADLDRNFELYDPELTAGEYHAWLHENAVRWVAVPDVALDEGGAPEGAVLASYRTIPWLDVVWSNGDWRLFEVLDYVPIVDPPAELVRQGVDSLVLRTPAAGDVTLRYEYSDDLAVSGAACIEARPDDEWMTVTFPAAGEYTLTADPGELLPGADPDTCA